MRFVIRKGSLFDNLFLTASHRWGRLDKAKTFAGAASSSGSPAGITTAPSGCSWAVISHLAWAIASRLPNRPMWAVPILVITAM